MSAYSDLVVATSGLASYWRLGESSGTTATAAFGATNGTYTGSGVTYGQPGLLAGDPSATSVLFDDGIPGSCSFGDVYDFTGTAAFSAEVWVKTDGTETDSYIWTKGDYSTGGWFISYGDPVLVTRRIDSGGVDDGSFIASGLSSSVHHIVTTYDGSTITLYVDGIGGRLGRLDPVATRTPRPCSDLGRSRTGAAPGSAAGCRTRRSTRSRCPSGTVRGPLHGRDHRGREAVVLCVTTADGGSTLKV